MTDAIDTEFTEDEWDVVSDESPAVVVFDTPGDQFVGVYEGMETIENPTAEKDEDKTFDRFLFRHDGHPYAINSSYRMIQGMAKVEIGQKCRLTFVKEIPARKGNPLKDIKVEVARKRAE